MYFLFYSKAIHFKIIGIQKNLKVQSYKKHYLYNIIYTRFINGLLLSWLHKILQNAKTD